MKRFENKLIADIVIDNINTSKIFKKYNIDYCIEGKKNLSTICKKRNIDIQKITDDLSAVNSNIYYLQDYNSWELNFLIHFLSDIHHDYKEENILLLKEYAHKVAHAYTNEYKELKEINSLIQDISEEILEHMKNEETILFPYLKELLKLKEAKVKTKTSELPKVKSIDDFEDEHFKIRRVFNKIAQLTQNYTVPKNVCNAFKLLYTRLQKFDNELQDHIHIENNILFPKAKELERLVLAKDTSILV